MGREIQLWWKGAKQLTEEFWGHMEAGKRVIVNVRKFVAEWVKEQEGER